MKKTLSALTILTSTLMAVTTAQANNFYIGTSLSYDAYHEKLLGEDNEYDSLTLGFDIGYRFTSPGIDLSLYIAPPQTFESTKLGKYGKIEDSVGQCLFKATYAFLGGDKTRMINPYIGATLGVYSIEHKASLSTKDDNGTEIELSLAETEVDVGLGALIGAEYKINDRFVAYTEASYALITKDDLKEETKILSNIKDDEKTKDNFKFLVGIKYTF